MSVQSAGTSAGPIRIGVLTPHAALGPEAEFPQMAPGRIMTCVARLSAEAMGGGANPATLPGLRSLATPRLLDKTADLFARGSVAVIAYASTSSGYAIGSENEATLVSRLARLIGVPVASTCAAAVLALRVLGVQRIALVHPPWFDDELNTRGAAYFQGEAFEVVSSSSAALTADPGRIEAAEVYEWTSRHVADDAEAVFIGGNGFRAAGAIAPLESVIGRPVLTANQVLLWTLLAEVGAAFQVSGYGDLFLRAPTRPR